MMKKQLLAVTLILVLLATPVVALAASNISGAQYWATIQISNNSTAETNVATTANISTQNLIDGNYLNSSANNCAIRTSSGADVPFMPSPNSTYPWCIWVPSIGAYSYQSDILYTANSTGGEIRYFPGIEGMTTPDNNVSLEPGANFTFEQTGWVDTDKIREDVVYETGYDTHRQIQGINWYAQTFTTSTSLTIDAIHFRVFRVGVPGDIGAGIRATDSATGKPLGADLVSGTISGNGFTVAAAGEWYQVDLSDNYTLAPATQYALVISCPAGIANNDIYWKVDTSSGYADGGTSFSGDSGVTWGAVSATDDFMFRIYDAGMNLIEKNRAFRTYIVDDTDIRSAVYNTDGNEVATANATGISSDEHIVKTTLEPALDFVFANTDWVSVVSHADFSFTDGNDLPFTIIGWLNMDDVTGGAIISKNVAVANQREWVLTFNAGDDSLRIICQSNDAANWITRYTGVVTAYEGLWTHFAVTYDGSEAPSGFNIYIDGVDSDTTSNSGGAYTGMTAGTGTVAIGANLGGTADYLDGIMSELKVYKNREFTPAEILADYNGIHSNTSLIAWYEMDEGSGNTIGDSSGLTHTGTNNGADWVIGPLKIFVDNALEGIGNGVSVPNNNNAWTFLERDVMLYAGSDNGTIQQIWIDGALSQHIEWEYGTTFDDLSVNNNDATPTFRTASSDAHVSAEMINFQPIAEAKAPDYVLGVAPPFIDPGITGNVTSAFTTTPGAGTFPLAGVIEAVAAATGTPPQLPLLIIAVFIILAASLSVSAIMRRYGSGSLLVKIIVVASLMGVFVAIGNFAIDFWMIVIFASIGVAIAFASKQVGWS